MSTPSYLPQLETDLNNISALSRLPNKDNELSYKELQEKFDKAGNDIKTYINETLLKAIEDAIISGGGQMSGTNIEINSLPANRIENTSITDAQMSNEAVTATKIASGAVTSVKLASNAVSADKIASGAVTSAKLDASSVINSKIADDAVTAAKLDDTSVVVTVNGKVGNPYITKFKTGTSSAFNLQSPATLDDYKYRASIPDPDVTANDKVYVEFNPTQINEGIYAPITVSYSGGFYIYADSSHSAETIAYTILKA